jgi:hypothetical protein
MMVVVVVVVVVVMVVVVVVVVLVLVLVLVFFLDVTPLRFVGRYQISKNYTDSIFSS